MSESNRRVASFGQKLELLFTLITGVTIWGILLLFGPFNKQFGPSTTLFASGLAVFAISYISFAYASFYLKKKWMLWMTGLFMMLVGVFFLGDLPFLFGWSGGLLSIAALLPFGIGISVIMYAQQVGQQQPDSSFPAVDGVDSGPKMETGLKAVSASSHSFSDTPTAATTPSSLESAQQNDPIRTQVWIVGSYFTVALITAVTIILCPSLGVAKFTHSTYDKVSLYMIIPIVLCMFAINGLVNRNPYMILATGVLTGFAILAGAMGTLHLFYSFHADGYPFIVVALSFIVTLMNLYIGHLLSQIWKCLTEQPAVHNEEYPPDDDFIV